MAAKGIGERMLKRIGAALALLALSCGAAAAQSEGDAAAPQVQAGAPSFGECEKAVDEAALRAEVFDGSREAMRRAAFEVDYATVVQEAWAASDFDRRFAVIVDDKIAILRKDRAYLERLLDGNIPSRAEDMARRTADLVFYSPEFEELQEDLQKQIGARLEPLVASADLKAKSAAARCVQTFLSARYAASVRDAFDADLAAFESAAGIDAGGVGTSAAISLAGVVAAMLTVVFRRLVRRIVAQIVRRLAGALAARLAAWASVILGAALLVYELVAGADGVFPIIRDELVSDETRREIQNGLIEELAATGPERLDERATQIAGVMFERWREFKSAHRATLELADREPRFAAFLAEQPPGKFDALSTVVKALRAEAGSDAEAGDAAVMAALQSGLLADAIALPDAAERIEAAARSGLSVADLVTWRRLAGDRFDQAMDWRLPSALDPAELSPAELGRLLDLGSREAGLAIARLEPALRAEALETPSDQLRRLTQTFDGADLGKLFQAVRPLPQPGLRRSYIQRAAADPTRGRRMARAADAVAASADPQAALEMLLDPAPVWSPFALSRHVDQVVGGDVAPMVLVGRYGWGLAVAVGLPLLLVIGFLRWIGGLFGFARRRRDAR